MGESTTRSQSPYDPELHTMEEVDVPNSSLVHGEPALSGGVGVGGWAPLDDGEGMDLDQTADAPGEDGADEGAFLQAGVTGSVPLVGPGGGGYTSAKARKNAIKKLKRKLP